MWTDSSKGAWRSEGLAEETAGAPSQEGLFWDVRSLPISQPAAGVACPAVGFWSLGQSADREVAHSRCAEAPRGHSAEGEVRAVCSRAVSVVCKASSWASELFAKEPWTVP